MSTTAPILATREPRARHRRRAHRRRCLARGPRGRVRRHHRPERGRQDDALQPALGPHAADGRRRGAARPRRDSRLPPYRRTRAGLGRTFQVSSVFPLLSVFENVRLAAEAELGGTLRIWRRALSVREAVERARWALERVGLAARASVARRPALARRQAQARARDAARRASRDVILLDEPMAGVSVEDVDELVELIGSVHREEGKTVLMVEHRMEVVVGLAERIAVMHHGALARVRHAGRGDGERDRPDGLPRGAALMRPAEPRADPGRRPARLPRRVARPPGRLVRGAGGRRDGAARPERRRQDDDDAGAARPRAAAAAASRSAARS